MIKIRVHETSTEFALLEMYCDTKTKIWNTLFGYYKTSGEWIYYKVSKRVWQTISKTAENLEGKYEL